MRRLFLSDSGTSVAELALILPTFLLILFAIVEGSVVLSAWMILTNETREAARYAVAGVRDGDTNLVTQVTNFMQTDLGSVLNTTGLTTTVTVTGTSGFPSYVTVSAHYLVPMQTPFTKAVLGTVPINVTSVMRAE